jgi:predicted nucleic acid-binding protein
VTVLLDTSVVIDLLRGNAAALDAVRGAVEAGHDLGASVVVKVEVLAGMRPPEEQPKRRLLGGIEWIAVDDLIAESAGMLANQYARSHTGIDPMDCIIAATVYATTVRQDQNARLWTRNVKHFPMFASLAPPY